MSYEVCRTKRRDGFGDAGNNIFDLIGSQSCRTQQSQMRLWNVTPGRAERNTEPRILPSSEIFNGLNFRGIVPRAMAYC